MRLLHGNPLKVVIRANVGLIIGMKKRSVVKIDPEIMGARPALPVRGFRPAR
jgi:hypothetical protein